jgi:hypothetical protein
MVCLTCLNREKKIIENSTFAVIQLFILLARVSSITYLSQHQTGKKERKKTKNQKHAILLNQHADIQILDNTPVQADKAANRTKMR